MRPAPLALLVALLLAGGAAAQEDDAPSHRDVWAELDPAERAALLERGRKLAELPPEEREALVRRAATLERIRNKLREEYGREPTTVEIRSEVDRLMRSAREVVEAEIGDRAEPADGPATGTLRERLHDRTARDIRRYLDGRVEAGAIGRDDATRILALDLHDRMFEVLRLLKRDRLAELSGTLPPEQLRELEQAEPLELLRRLRAGRDEELLRARSTTQLTPEQRAELERTPAAERPAKRLRMMRENTRRRLLEQGVDPERVDELAPPLDDEPDR